MRNKKGHIYIYIYRERERERERERVREREREEGDVRVTPSLTKLSLIVRKERKKRF
jgi:hypothetical protein